MLSSSKLAFNMISLKMMMKHKQQPVHAQHSRVNRNKFGNKIRLGKAVAATFAASRETDLDVAANVEITFTERFQSL